MKKTIFKIKKIKQKRGTGYVTRSHFDTEIKGIRSDTSNVKVETGNIKHELLEIKDYLKVADERQERMITLLDYQTKEINNLRDEFVIQKAEMAQIKKVIKEKLGIEIRAA